MRKRRVWWLALVAIIAIAYLYPVGGTIWRSSQVTGVAIGRGEQRRELRDYKGTARVIDEALGAARADRFRRLIPGVDCSAMDLQFRTADRWVETQLSCANGFLFDTTPRDQWR